MKGLIGCVFCFGLGLGMGYFLRTPRVDEPPAGQAESHYEHEGGLVQRLERQLSSKDSLIGVLNEELSEVRAALSAELAAENTGATDSNASANPFMGNIGPMSIEMTQSYHRQELEKYKRTLKLRPDQVKALEEFYQREADQQTRMMQQMFSGKSMEAILEESQDDFEGITHFTVGDVLEDILTPEQLATYETNKEKEAIEEQEGNAYSELSQIQRQFVLDDDHKDAVFAIFYEKEYEVDPEELDTLEAKPGEIEFGMKYQELENERLLTALSEVLDEEQLNSYRKKLEADLEMQRNAMKLFSSEGGFLQPSIE